MKKEQVKPRYKVGEVVCVKAFIEKRYPGETGPGFRLKPGWRWGWSFAKVVKLIRPSKHCIGGYCYFLAEFPSAMTERELRPLTERERGDAQ